VLDKCAFERRLKFPPEEPVTSIENVAVTVCDQGADAITPGVELASLAIP